VRWGAAAGVSFSGQWCRWASIVLCGRSAAFLVFVSTRGIAAAFVVGRSVLLARPDLTVLQALFSLVFGGAMVGFVFDGSKTLA
jgi:hypothetical protein